MENHIKYYIVTQKVDDLIKKSINPGTWGSKDHTYAYLHTNLIFYLAPFGLSQVKVQTGDVLKIHAFSMRSDYYSFENLTLSKGETSHNNSDWGYAEKLDKSLEYWIRKEWVRRLDPDEETIFQYGLL